MYRIFILLVLNFAFFVKANVPQRCEEISISAYDYQNTINTSVSLIIQVSDGMSSNIVTVKNLTRTFQQLGRDSGKKLLGSVNTTVCISIQCFSNFVNSVTASVDNGIFDVSVQWNLLNEDFTYKLFNGIVDQRNLIFYDGSLFSETRKCMAYSDVDYLPSLKTCCTSFKSIPEAPLNSTKCTNFKAVSSVFEMQNNNLIATNSANFVLTDNDITAIWHYKEDDRFTHIFSMNDAQCQSAPGGIQYCDYYIGNQEKELLIQDKFNEEFVGGPNILVGRIILRDDQTMMEEGIPFSASNPCQNITGIVALKVTNVTFRVVNQFCCSDFDVTTTKPTASSVSAPTPSPTKLIAQQCSKISSFSVDGYTANVTTNMQVKYLEHINNVYISDVDISTADNISDISICVYGLLETPLMCQNVTSNSANLTVSNNIIKITISYITEGGGLYSIDLFNGIIDQGNFISTNGILFDDNENKCFNSSTSSTNTKFCCTSSSTQNTQTPIYLPKCTNFKISSTFFNTTTDNIYTSATSEFILSETDLTAKGNYIGEIPTLYSINNYVFQRGVNKTQFGGFPVQNSNSEFFIQTQYYSATEKIDSVFVGRIILLEGQTFLEQGIPLTAANNCLNVTSPYHDIHKQYGIDVVSELCCIAFDGNSVTTTSLPSTLPSSVSSSTTTSPSTTTKPMPSSSSLPIVTGSTVIAPNSTMSGLSSTISTTTPASAAMHSYEFSSVLVIFIATLLA